MDEQQYLELISTDAPTVVQRLLRVPLRIASWGYSAVMSVRNWLFDRDVLPIYETPVPVISVGNLTTGGTGKTPVVAQLVAWLGESGKHPGIVSRGYKQLSEAGNDEARVLELACPGIPHVQNRDRVKAVFDVSLEHGAEAIVADDAFQHRRMSRALDVVLIDARQPWGQGHVLPRGLLREAKRGLKRAGAVVLTRADQVDDSVKEAIWNEVHRFKPDAPKIEVAFHPDSLVDVDGQRHPLKTIDGSVFAFCGIGNPDAFRSTLEQQGLTIGGFHAFADHHHYAEADLLDLARQASESGADCLVTTVKDLVKIDAAWLSGTSLQALDIRTRFLNGEDVLREQVILAAKLQPGS